MSSPHLFTNIPQTVALGLAEEDMRRRAMRDHDLNLNYRWQPTEGSSIQELTLDRGLWNGASLLANSLDESELRTVVSPHYHIINDRLAEWGYSIRLEPFPANRNNFGFAASLSRTGKLTVSGKTGYYIKDRYPAFRLGSNTGVNFFRSQGHDVIRISTASAGEYVYITRVDNELSGFDLLAESMLVQGTMTSGNNYSGVIVPSFSIKNYQVDVAGLLGMSAHPDGQGPVWWLSQALMEAECNFGPVGYSFKAAFAGAASKGIAFPGEYEENDHVIDYDLMMWISRPTVSTVPLGVAYVPTTFFSMQDVRV